MIDTVNRTPPLVLIAIDGADAGLIERWAREGHLPTIASMLRRGGRGRISGPELLSTHGAWLSFFSGISRSEHGHYYNRQLVPGTYRLQDVTAGDSRALPFWSHYRDGSKSILTIDALETDPCPGLRGVQLSNWAVQQQFNRPRVPASAEPATLLKEANHAVGPPMFIDVYEPGSLIEDDAAAHGQMIKRVEMKGALTRRWLAQQRYDLAVVGFVEAHTAAHRLWDYRPGGIRQDENRSAGYNLRSAIREVYRAIDREIGLLLKDMPDEPNVFIVSLFGMKDLYPTTGLIEEFCRKLGYQASVRESHGHSALARIRRLVRPDLRARVSRLLPRAVRLRLEADKFEAATDWSRTKAFSLPALNTSFVRVNLRGREPQGIVEPGIEYERLLDQMESDLRQLTDVRSGRPAVETVIRTARAFRSGPPPLLPDLCVEWQRTPYLMDRIRHPQADLAQVRPQYDRSSYHTFEGFVTAAGPSIRTGDFGCVTPLDFVPAFRSLMGESSGQQFNNPFVGEAGHHPSKHGRKSRR